MQQGERSTLKDGSLRGQILIVDDEPEVRRLLGHVLSRVGHEVTTVGEAREAMAYLDRRPFDLVITDLLMPGMSGLELQAWARGRGLESVWIILTGSGRYEDAIQAVKSEVFDYLCKPIHDLNLFRETVANALQRCRSTRHRNRQWRMIHDELEQARAIEQSLLPNRLPSTETLSTYSYYQPCHEVGGDMYDVFPLGIHHLGFYIADAAGHGVSSAMLTVMGKSLMQPMDPANPSSPRRPAEVLSALAERLHRHTEESAMFITAAYGVLDTRDLTLSYASAGHPASLLVRRNGDVVELSSTGPAIGVKKSAAFGESLVALECDDRLLVYSDGVIEARNRSGEFFGESRLKEQLVDGHHLPDQLIPRILAALARFAPYATEDDVTILLVSADGLRNGIIHSPLPLLPSPAATVSAT